MLTDLELATLELNTYAVTPIGEVYDAGNDRAVVTRMADRTVVSFTGSNSPEDWISNFKVLGVHAADHPTLGICEDGFLRGASGLWTILAPILGDKPVIVQGHSRGAGMVPIFAAIMVTLGIKPERCVMWEAPWCVGATCKQLLLSAGIDGVQWWHGDDPVPTVPAVPWLVPNVWPIKHFGHWSLRPFDCHFMAGIIATLAAPVIGGDNSPP